MTAVQHFYLSAFLTALFNILLVLLVAWRSRAATLKRLFVWYGSAIGIWSTFLLFFSSVGNQRASYIFCQSLHAASIFIPCLFLHFVLTYLNQLTLRQKIVLRAAYLVSAFFWVLDVFFSRLFIASVVPKLGFPYFMEPGPFYHYWMGVFFLIVIYGHLILLRGVLSAKGRMRKQRQFFLVGNLIGYLGGLGSFLPVYNITLFPYPYGSYGVALFSAVTVYTILRFRFIDIEVIIKRTIVFAGLFSFAFGTFAFFTFLTQELFNTYLSGRGGRILSLGISVLIIVLGYDPLRQFLVNITDRYLFQKKESFKVTLNRLSKSIITILDLEQVGERILSSLRESLRLESGAIIIKDENDEGFQILNSYNIHRKEPRYPKESHLIQYLKDRDDMIRLEDEERKALLPPEVTTELQELNSVLCIPLFLHNDLIGILTLGKKKSDEEFTQEELEYVPAVAGQVAIALSNARLVDILKKSQADFAQQAKMAAIGTLSAGIGHEIKNPLQIIKGLSEMLKINQKAGIYDKLTKEEYVSLVEEMVQKNLVAVERAVGIIDRLSSFAKKPKEFKIEPMSVKEALEEALSLVKTDFENYSVNIERKYAPNLPNIQADMHAVGQAFFNILVNARHALKEKGTVTVSTALRNHEVEISIQDTGPGIAPENLHKIFDPFFTTKDTSRNTDPSVVKGTGLGLFIVRETIKKFGGRITVESELGKGTTFHIFLPALQN